MYKNVGKFFESSLIIITEPRVVRSVCCLLVRAFEAEEVCCSGRSLKYPVMDPTFIIPLPFL
jgi:hypothetical protein